MGLSRGVVLGPCQCIYSRRGYYILQSMSFSCPALVSLGLNKNCTEALTAGLSNCALGHNHIHWTLFVTLAFYYLPHDSTMAQQPIPACAIGSPSSSWLEAKDPCFLAASDTLCVHWQPHWQTTCWRENKRQKTCRHKQKIKHKGGRVYSAIFVVIIYKAKQCRRTWKSRRSITTYKGMNYSRSQCCLLLTGSKCWCQINDVCSIYI